MEKTLTQYVKSSLQKAKEVGKKVLTVVKVGAFLVMAGVVLLGVVNAASGHKPQRPYALRTYDQNVKLQNAIQQQLNEANKAVCLSENGLAGATLSDDALGILPDTEKAKLTPQRYAELAATRDNDARCEVFIQPAQQ